MKPVVLLAAVAFGCDYSCEVVIAQPITSAPTAEVPFYVYRDGASTDNHGEWTNRMPDPQEFPKADEMLEVSLAVRTLPNSGKSCVRIQVNRWSSPLWTGVAVASKANYWGKEASDQAYDLTKFRRLVFYARGEDGGETIQTKVAVTGQEKFGDSARDPAASPWIELSKQWQRFEIPIGDIDRRRVITPFAVFVDKSHNDVGAMKFYLDDIYFE